MKFCRQSEALFVGLCIWKWQTIPMKILFRRVFVALFLFHHSFTLQSFTQLQFPPENMFQRAKDQMHSFWEFCFAREKYEFEQDVLWGPNVRILEKSKFELDVVWGTFMTILEKSKFELDVVWGTYMKNLKKVWIWAGCFVRSQCKNTWKV